jgi:hypothetical protein
MVETLDGWRKAKLVLLDAGMAMRLSRELREVSGSLPAVMDAGAGWCWW